MALPVVLERKTGLALALRASIFPRIVANTPGPWKGSFEVARRRGPVLFAHFNEKRENRFGSPCCFGAENGTRTRDLNLGKVALYQLSYFRMTFP